MSHAVPWQEEICNHCRKPGARCDCLAEVRKWKTVEGRAELQAAYKRELHEAINGKDHPSDAQLAVRLHKLGVPGQAIEALRMPEENTAWKGAERFIGSHRSVVQFLALLGPVGCGKTVAAARVMQEFAKRFPWNEQASGPSREPAMWVGAKRLTGLASWESNDKAWMDAMTKAQLLVVDDVGDEATKVGAELLTNLMLERGDHERRTVITGNLNPESFRKRYGDALADRFNIAAIAPRLADEKSRRVRR